MTNHNLNIAIINNASYQHLNTFNIQGQTKYLVNVHNETQLISAIAFAHQQQIPYIILGGGSNVLMTQNNEGLIIHIAIMGITKIDETDEYIYLKIGAGENWHEFVQYCLANNYYGIENLSLIPGTVGAAPIQNIGAYGVELKDVFHELEAVDSATGKMISFNRDACEFSYRNSIFKKMIDHFIVCNVTLRLNKQSHMVLTDNSVKNELSQLSIQQPNPKQLSDIICNIRKRKLPYDKNIGNAGSFFMNPMIAESQFIEIKTQYSDAVGFSVGNGQVKIAAGWMIDKCGWRGFREGDAGIYEHNALVLVNYGQATGEQILMLAEKVNQSVSNRFDVSLQIEPRIY